MRDPREVSRAEREREMQAKSLSLWMPSQSVAFRLLLVPRLLGAFLMHISDCDETYNYWEPVIVCIVSNNVASVVSITDNCL